LCDCIGSLLGSAHHRKDGRSLIVRFGFVLDAIKLQVKRFRPWHFELLTKLIELVAGERPRLVEQELLLTLQFNLAAFNDREWIGTWLVHAASLARQFF
jgi:hypothetical protein